MRADAQGKLPAAGAAPGGAEHQALQQAYETLRQQAEVAPAEHCAGLAQLARRADAAGMGGLARRAHCSAAHGFAAIGQLAHAEDELRQCLLLARRDKDRGDQHRAVFVRATIQRDSGLHDASVRSLLSLLQAETMAEMPAPLRFAVLDMLGEACLPVDPIDSVDACLGLATGAWAGSDASAPAVLPHFFLVSRAGHYLDRFHWSAPDFQTLLSPVKLQREEIALLLDRALQDCAAAQASVAGPPPTPLVQEAARLIAALAQAHRRKDSQRVIDAWRHLCAIDVSNPRFQLRAGHQVASAFLLLGQPALAAEVVEHVEARLSAVGGCMERRLFWSHLRAVVAAGNGQMAESLTLYAQYSQAAFTHAGRMNLHIKHVINRAAGLFQNTATAPPDAIPQYLRKALDLMGQPRYQLLQVEQLAELVGVSSRSLRTAFARHLGASPKEVSTLKRLEAAMTYLRTQASPQEPITQIGQKFGFSNSARFVAQFKRHYGESPLAYVRQRP